MKKVCIECKEPLTGKPPEVQQLKEDFGKNWEPEDCVVVCDDCYKKFMKWKKETYN